MVGDRELGARTAVAAAVRIGHEAVLAVAQSGQYAAHGARVGVGDEAARHVLSIQQQLHLVQRHVARHRYLDQRIAAADEIGAVGERADVELMPLVGLGFGQGGDAGKSG